MKHIYNIGIILLLVFSYGCKTARTTVPEQTGNTSTLEETYWKLTEIMGKAVGPTPADKKEIHLKFRKDGNKVEAFGGCNGLGGTYTLEKGNRIRISDLIGTMMACDQLETENQLKEILKMADNYSLNGTQLTLNKARMAPLARFEAVYFK